MNLARMIHAAQAHMADNYTGGRDTEMLLSRFAQEQMGYTSQQADEWAIDAATSDANECHIPPAETFYTWYFITIMVGDSLQDLHNDYVQENGEKWIEDLEHLIAALTDTAACAPPAPRPAPAAGKTLEELATDLPF